MDSRTWQAFLGEFAEIQKAAASAGRLTISKSRSGRRSMSVSTLLRKEKDGTLYKEAFHEHIPGGLAAGKKPSQFPAKSLAQGRGVEMEHTRSPEIATEIAMDHITEDPRYYGKLRKMEKESEYQEVDPRNPTIKQVVRNSRGDVPNRDDIPGRTTLEFRPNMMGTTPAGRGLAPEGFNY